MGTAENNIAFLDGALRALRRDKSVKETSPIIEERILDALKVSNESREKMLASCESFDYFIIEMILECFGKGLDSDIILVASGLLSGYDYHRYPKLIARRAKFLEDSNYLQNFPISKKAKKVTTSNDKEIIDYNDLSWEGKKTCYKNLQAEEDKRFTLLAIFLSKQDIDDRISKINNDKHSWRTGLPTPSYPVPNYEKLIWLELKKTNRTWHFPGLGGMVNKENTQKAILPLLCIGVFVASLFAAGNFASSSRQANSMHQNETIGKIPVSPFSYSGVNIDESRRKALIESRVTLTNDDEIANQSKEGILRASSLPDVQTIEEDSSLYVSKEEPLPNYSER